MSSGSLFAFSSHSVWLSVCRQFADGSLTECWQIDLYGCTCTDVCFCSALLSRIKTDWWHETAYLYGNVLNGFFRFEQKIDRIDQSLQFFVKIFLEFWFVSPSLPYWLFWDFFLHWHMNKSFLILYGILKWEREEKRANEIMNVVNDIQFCNVQSDILTCWHTVMHSYWHVD